MVPAPLMEKNVSRPATSTDLTSLVGPYAEPVDRRLREYLKGLDGPEPLIDAICYAALAPGKRIRPALVLMSAEACGGQQEPALPAACAVEMIHAYSLVHDDLPSMDDDDLRRGRPTVHKVYGEAIAILAGDALGTEAFRIIAREVADGELVKSLVDELSEAAGLGGMVSGQAADMLAEGRQGDEKTLNYICANKTGKLIRACCRMGALTAGACQAEFLAVSEYGRAVGTAFQIIDDLLDLSGSAEDMGKAVGKDASAGKLTHPAILGVAGAREKVRRLSSEAAEALGPLQERGKKLLLLAEILTQRVN